MTLNEQDENLHGLQASQIVYLDHNDHRLYVELIQIIQERHKVWLRPLCLRIPISQVTEVESHQLTLVHDAETPYALYDMRHSADLLWPLSDCRIALDTDVIPLLSHLGPEPIASVGQDDARQTLNQFIRKMWD